MTDPIKSIMDWVSQFTLVHLYSMGAAAAVTVLVVLFVRLWFPRLLRGVAGRFHMEVEDGLLGRVVGLLTTTTVLLGLWAIARAMPVPASLAESFDKIAAKGTALLLTLVVAYVLVRIVNEIAGRFTARLRDQEGPRTAYVAAVRKITNIALVLIAGLLMLSTLGYKIGPLLASLGVAGIAVALALQDTLGNLFSGLYLTFDQPVRPGDYIVLNSGEEGFVESIGWRSTKIRPWANTLVIIPNSKLSEATITNWHLPVPERSVYVWGGVDYGSDLEEVERVCVEVASEVMQRVEGAALDWDPVLRYKEFGDSNISFVVVLRVVDPTAIYIMQHEYVKALHKRFREESIEISWPVRKVVFPHGAPDVAVPEIAVTQD